MSLTPIGTSHVLVFRYVTLTRQHSSRYYVTAVPSSDPTGYDLQNNGSGLTPLTDAVDDWQAVFGPCCGLGSTANGWTLYSVGVGELIPIVSGSYTFTAVGGGVEIAGQATLTYRDSVNKLFKVEVLEGNYETPARGTGTASLGTAFNNLRDSIKGNSAGDIGYWAKSRSSHDIHRFIAYTATLNRKIRRKAGYV